MIQSSLENVKPEQMLNNDSTADAMQVSPAIGNTNVSSRLHVVDISYGGCTGINDYFISDGRIITCQPEKLGYLLNTKNKKDENI